MTYKIEIYPDAREQIAALSVPAQLKLAEALVVLELTPWNGPPINKQNPRGEVRQLLFGPHGAGMLTYLILEHQQEVHVVKVLWAD